MSLATRCPHCKTIFHVSEEQLRLRAGTVRCGVCRKLFNGIDNLAGRISRAKAADDLTLPDNTENTLPLTEPAVSVPSTEALKESFDRQLQSLSLELDTATPAEPAISPDVSGTPDENRIPPSGDAKQPEPSSDTLAQSAQVPSNHPATYPENDAGNALQGHSQTDDLFETIQRKKRKSRIAGVFWLAGSIVLAILLCGQIVYHYGSHIVTLWPPAKGLVDSTCEMLSCPTGNATVPGTPWHIEYGEPTPAENATGHFTQSVTLFHDSESPQPWPSLIVEITGPDNQVLSRRVIEPDEYLAETTRHPAVWPAGEKNHIQLFIEQPHDTVIHSRIVPFNH